MRTQRDPEKVVREIKRKTRRKFSSEEKISIVLEGLRGEETIAELSRTSTITGPRNSWRQVSVAWLVTRSAKRPVAKCLT